MLLIEKLKGARKSLVIWFNGLMLAILPLVPVLIDSLPTMQPYLPANFFKYAMLGVLVINLVLRFRTGQPLQDK